MARGSLLSNDKEAFTSAQTVPLAVSLIRLNAGSRRPLPRLSAAARLALTRYEWHGDRQALERCIQHALVLCESEVIEVQHLGLTRRTGDNKARTTILSVLTSMNGARREAAAELGISARTLRFQLADLRAQGVPVPAAGSASAELRND